MTDGDGASKSRKVTDDRLRAERGRADDEVLQRSTALGETAEDVIRRARERARDVLALARRREDETLAVGNIPDETREQVQHERDFADKVLAGEYAEADAEILDELSKRRRAVIQLLALERGETDRVLAWERRAADRRVASRDDLLGFISHDMRNHLSALLVSASVLILSHKDDEKLVGIVRGMQTSLAQMDNLVGSFLDLTSLEAGRAQIKRARVDLLPIVADEVVLHRPAAEARSIQLTFSPTVAALPVEVDPQAMSRVLLNVISNAIKYTPKGGSIEVHLDRDGNEAAIAVRDTGPGIAADQLEAIFERFQQGEADARGYGLGLDIARAIITAHGGRIWAESTPGTGATFQIRLPASA